MFDFKFIRMLNLFVNFVINRCDYHAYSLSNINTVSQYFFNKKNKSSNSLDSLNNSINIRINDIHLNYDYIYEWCKDYKSFITYYEYWYRSYNGEIPLY